MNNILLKKKEIHKKIFQGEIINKYKIIKKLDIGLNKEIYKVEEEEFFEEIFNNTSLEEFKGFFKDIKNYCKSISFFIHTDTNKGKYSFKDIEYFSENNIIFSENINSLVGIDYDPDGEDFFYSINSNKNNFKSENIKDLELLLKIVNMNVNNYKKEKEKIIYDNPGFENTTFMKKILVFSEDNQKFLIPNIVLFNLLSLVFDIKKLNLDETEYK